jgi:hypothetical protein
MTEKDTKKSRRALTAVRMWKVSDTKAAELGMLTDPNATVADYINVRTDEALEEVAKK